MRCDATARQSLKPSSLSLRTVGREPSSPKTNHSSRPSSRRHTPSSARVPLVERRESTVRVHHHPSHPRSRSTRRTFAINSRACDPLAATQTSPRSPPWCLARTTVSARPREGRTDRRGSVDSSRRRRRPSSERRTMPRRATHRKSHKTHERRASGRCGASDRSRRSIEPSTRETTTRRARRPRDGSAADEDDDG
jgi:hypothetical protein